MVSEGTPIQALIPDAESPKKASAICESPSRLKRLRTAFTHTLKHSRPSSSVGNFSSEGFRLGSKEDPGAVISQSVELSNIPKSTETYESTEAYKKSSSMEIDKKLISESSQEETSKSNRIYTTTSPSSDDEEDDRATLLKSDPFRSWNEYFLDLVKTCWACRNKLCPPESVEANKARQLRLIMFEALEHIDLITDSLLVIRLLGNLMNPNTKSHEIVATVLLTGILVTSTVTYLCRPLFIFHKIQHDDAWIFCPGLPFFRKVRECGNERPTVLLMYERLQWTYSLVMRVLEDVPQLLVVLCLLAQDSGILLILDASTSLMTLFASSFRMGSLYPYKSSLALLISSAPPIDSPVVLEASPTNAQFPWLISFTAFVMGICHAICSSVVHGHKLQSFLYSALSFASFTIAFCAASYASYLSRQYLEYQSDMYAVPAQMKTN